MIITVTCFPVNYKTNIYFFFYSKSYPFTERVPKRK